MNSLNKLITIFLALLISGCATGTWTGSYNPEADKEKLASDLQLSKPSILLDRRCVLLKSRVSEKYVDPRNMHACILVLTEESIIFSSYKKEGNNYVQDLIYRYDEIISASYVEVNEYQPDKFEAGKRSQVQLLTHDGLVSVVAFRESDKSRAHDRRATLDAFEIIKSKGIKTTPSNGYLDLEPPRPVLYIPRRY